jgi:hypothetical protein
LLLHNEVGTTCVSGWIEDSSLARRVSGPPAHAGGTDFMNIRELKVKL